MDILNNAAQLPGYAVSNVGLGVTFDTINNAQNASSMSAFNKEVVDNMSPFLTKKPDVMTSSAYVFYAMKEGGKWRAAALDMEKVNDPSVQPFYVSEGKFDSPLEVQAYLNKVQVGKPWNTGKMIKPKLWE